MTARPIRYQRQVSDRKGKNFYTSITSLSHISKITRYETAYGRSWTCSPRHCSCPYSWNNDEICDVIIDFLKITDTLIPQSVSAQRG